MIRIELSDSTTASLRIGISPITEVIGAVELLHRYGTRAPWPYGSWARRAEAVPGSPATGSPLSVYGRLLDAKERQRTPDVFHPVPASAAPTLEEELEALCRTPQSVVDEQFATHYPAGVPGWLTGYGHHSSRSFALLAESLWDFWRRALRPIWSRIRAALDEEVLLRGRVLAMLGPEAILADLSTGVRWEQPVLSLPKSRESALDAAGQRLLLTPALFANRRVTCSTDDPAVLRLTYQCRGAAVLAEHPGRPGTSGGDRMGRLVGDRRALILRALTTPATTSGLAARLGLPASTVSEHLTALHSAGVVHRRRAGRQVFYGLEPGGHALLALFPDPTADSATANRFRS